MSETQPKEGFGALNISPNILTKLTKLNFHIPTPIQREAIPVALKGRDLIGIAQTGTGKTLAFGIPMLELLGAKEAGLVLAPTRELAQQIEETFHKLGVSTALLIGGASMGIQKRQLRSRPSVIVATPGRLLDHMDQRTVDLRWVSIAVLDEADRMLDMGFAPAIRKILEATPTDRQTMLFSATMPREIADLAARYLIDPVRIEIERPGSAASLVEQELIVVPHERKGALLDDLLERHTGSILVFARTRHGARKLARNVRISGHSATEIHSDRTLAQRRAALQGFKSGTYRVLVATDIAARGIDVKDISLVINYDVPEKPEDYVHRIGRTGRAGSAGKSILVATPEQHRDVRDIETLLDTQIALSPRSPLSLERPKPPTRPARNSGPSRRPHPSRRRR